MADAGPNYGSEAVMQDKIEPPSVLVPGDDVPVKKINKEGLKSLGYNLSKLYMQYRSDRRIQELRWLRSLRQYLGYYDPEVEKELSPNRSRAYPKMTRVKCITLQAHLMDLMFPSDDRNWTLQARPSPDMDAKDIKEAIAEKQALDQAAGVQSTVDMDYVTEAAQDLATKRAKALTLVIDDQLEELGGDQAYDYVALNNEVIESGIKFGAGFLRGPYARKVKSTQWVIDPKTQQPSSKTITAYMPMFEFLSVWDYYPDLSAKRLDTGDGYFTRVVQSRHQVLELSKREDFFADVIKDYLAAHTIGNYRPEPFETELRAMGVKVNVNEMKIESTKYEVLVWAGKVSGNYLQMAGVEVASDKLAEEIDAEVWLLDGYVIKAALNPWASLGVDVKTLHYFIFDRDDTAPIGFGLPNVIRDTQMSISAATRMLLDNASVICGPILELNTALLRPDQDLSSLTSYKIFYRDDENPTAQWPAVRDVKIESHVPELQGIIELFMKFADIETFAGPAAGGDMENMPSEPMRNAAGASMIFGKASLPFKQIVRNFDRFTEGVIQSLVQFNRKFNPSKALPSEYDVIARGATSLIAKELRGMQVDQLAATLKPEEMLHIDARKLVEARIAVRDLDDLLVSEAEAARRQASQDAQAAQQAQQTQSWLEANIRKTLSDAFKNIAQGQKNQMGANVQAIDAALEIMEKGLSHGGTQQPDAGGGANKNPSSEQGQPPPPDASGIGGMLAAISQGQPGAMPPGGLPGGPGPSPGIPNPGQPS
jgi:hypothetical protein